MINNTEYPTYFIGEENNNCELITTIKEDYYKHIYKPRRVFENLNKWGQSGG